VIVLAATSRTPQFQQFEFFTAARSEPMIAPVFILESAFEKRVITKTAKVRPGIYQK